MARAAVALAALTLAGCSNNPYVIGLLADGGVGECSNAHAHALLCSGFEGVDLSTKWAAPTIENAGAIEGSTVRTHSGRTSLHASSRAMMSAAVVAASFPPVRTGELYFRSYVYVPAGLPTEIINIFFVGAEPVPDPFVGIDFNLQRGAVEIYSPQANPNRQTGTLLIPRDRWFCFRAQISVSHDRGAVQAFVDDARALDATSIDSLPPGGITTFRAGIDWSSSQDAFFEIFIDDVVIDTAPAACR